MSARTAMIDFKIDPVILNEQKKLDGILTKLKDYLSQHGFSQEGESLTLGTKGLLSVFLRKESESSCILRIYSSGLVSLSFEEFKLIDITNSKLENMRKDLMKLFQTRVEKTPAFKHATDVPVYFNNSEERVLEYDFNSIVFEADSPYQNIKILHSPTLGNCLILDDLQNLGDCDLSYTHALMKYGQISYAGKEILILGGGDGGLLHELLKEKPKFVTLVDIDLMVIEACRRHLRSVCGDCLDTFNGQNYQILVEDCFKIMDEYIQEGRKFDIIFNDLTDIPILTSPQGEQWQLVHKIVTMAFKLLKPNGRYLNHAIGITVKEALGKYEQLLSNINLGFSQHSAYVPSFLETWTFYEVWKLDENSPSSPSSPTNSS